MVGKGFILTSKFWLMPVQPPKFGVTTILPVVITATLAAVNPMSPVPLAPKPMVVLLFVQENVAPDVPVKATATGVPAQALKLAG